MGDTREEKDLINRYSQLRAEVHELLDILAAKEALDHRFIGMGHNIVQEKAARYKSQLRRVQKLLATP